MAYSSHPSTTTSSVIISQRCIRCLLVYNWIAWKMNTWEWRCFVYELFSHGPHYIYAIKCKFWKAKTFYLISEIVYMIAMIHNSYMDGCRMTCACCQNNWRCFSYKHWASGGRGSVVSENGTGTDQKIRNSSTSIIQKYITESKPY